MQKKIISDNALNLNNNMITKVCTQFKIKHHNSSPYHPKMNGAVEAANKNIKKIVGKMIGTYKDWHDKITICPLCLSNVCQNIHQDNTFFIVLPIEVEIPSLRVLSELKLDEAEWI
ncbi:receptor-like protein 12 [Gossypium australe]|uniref:Receptor-like protein 12 n=1 Tax=Gossypium australe TaxID=47621 RepID=A0A5B6X265_9ROSI|nr:receptor-like protein 12 [Gossypium australe]